MVYLWGKYGIEEKIMALSFLEYQQAQQSVMLYQQRVSGYQVKVLGLQNQVDSLKSIGASAEDIASAEAKFSLEFSKPLYS